MKKILSFFTLFILSLTIVACGEKEEGKLPSIPKNTPESIETPLVFSKLMIDYDVSGIELYNPSNEDVDLKHHFINIHVSSTNNVDTRILLKGKIKAKGFFFIVNEEISDERSIGLADQTYLGRRLTGSEAIVLFGGRTKIDIIGSVGAGYSYANNIMGSTYVRKENRLVQRDEFKLGDYLEFKTRQFDMLGKLETGITEEDFKLGPILSEEERELDFIGSDGLGLGGVKKVKVARLNDGDTTSFDYTYDGPLNEIEKKYLTTSNYGPTNMSTRYYYIDTPETQATRQEEFGYPASNFVNNILTEAEELGLPIEVQAPLYMSVDGSFGRFFGHVFVDGVSLSYLVIKYGLADTSISATAEESETYYKGMSYEAWMRQALYFAQDNKLGLHGEEDPSYIGNDKSDDIGFRPFFEKWYERSNVTVVKNETELIDAINSENISTIEIANDIEITKTIQIKDVSDKTIIGFGKEISGDKSFELFNIVDSTNITFDNIVFGIGKNPIIAKDSTINIDGLINIKNNEGPILGLSNVELEVGSNNKVKFINESSKVNIQFEYEDEALSLNRRLFTSQVLLRNVENNKTTYILK